MRRMHRSLIMLAAACLLVQGCGSSSHSSSAGSAGALSPEAKSAATGDIPDNQAFLSYHSSTPAYSISYPEGWTQKGSGTNVSFSDKNNVVHIVIGPAGSVSTASVTGELQGLKRANPTLTYKPPTPVHLKAGPAVEAVYTTRSAANQVTGKTVELIVDRYEMVGGGKRVTVDLGTARCVDNVDAYRMMINSFRWR
jgi:hypothetical protein